MISKHFTHSRSLMTLTWRLSDCSMSLSLILFVLWLLYVVTYWSLVTWNKTLPSNPINPFQRKKSSSKFPSESNALNFALMWVLSWCVYMLPCSSKLSLVQAQCVSVKSNDRISVMLFLLRITRFSHKTLFQLTTARATSSMRSTKTVTVCVCVRVCLCLLCPSQG